MTKEEKDLLVKDLCARVPYKTRVSYTFAFAGASAITEYSSEGILSYEKLQEFSLPNLDLEKRCVAHILPYLRPISSMTEEESKEFALFQTDFYVDGFLYPIAAINMINWLNSHYFDYCGLIERGLALEAPEDIYK